MNEQPANINWVIRTYNCRIDRVLDVIFEQVSEDVKERLKIKDIGEGVSFVVEDNRADQREFAVKKISVCKISDDDVPIVEVKFYCTRAERQDFIAAEMGGKMLKITRSWNSETASCDYFSNGKKAMPWQISAEAMRELFFGEA